MKKKLFLYFVFAVFLMAGSANARGMSIIRDDETERFLYSITRPILKAAGLNSNSIRIYVVNNDSVNAFVGGGQRIFVHTGLIMKYKTPDVLVGIMAHEIGHITGGHLVRFYENYTENVRLVGLSYLLAAAAALGGSPEAAQAAVMGGMQVAQQNVLRFSREQEEAADQASIAYMRAVGLSPAGLLEALEGFREHDVQNLSDSEEYMRTHPVSGARISHIKSYLSGSENNFKFNYRHQRKFDRVRGKLMAFLKPESEIDPKYLRNGWTLLARYVKSIVYYKSLETEKALKEINRLIKKYPRDPYFYELRGQILFESQKVNESIASYMKANNLLKDSVLIKIALANAILSAERIDLNQVALDNLNQALFIEKNNSMAWRLIAKAYNNAGDKGMASLSQAEYYLKIGKFDYAIKQATEAKLYLTNSVYITQADDVISQAREWKRNSR
jgi:predicted Zn-dependent protease